MPRLKKVRVFAEGYMHTAHPLCRPRCLEWAHMTRALYNGLAKDLLFAPAS
jgi:hypothetical protein